MTTRGTGIGDVPKDWNDAENWKPPREGEKVDVEDLRRLGLLDELPGAGRGLLEELRVKSIEELPQVRRDLIVRNLLLGGGSGKIVVDGKPIDFETEARELAGRDG